jgi:NADP-dependent 3-hydroxy acid dehydrogenase YdfG
MTKNAIVFGGTSGYGKGIAEYLTSKGWVVTGVGSAICDVREPDSVKDFFESVQCNCVNLDAVIFSSGKAIGKDYVSDKNPEHFRDVFAVNTIGLLNVLKYSFPCLLKRGGSFVHIGSIAHELSYVGGADYCASKSASNTIMKTIRKEWLGTGIRTTSFEVGLGNTNFQANRYKGDSEKAALHTNGVRQIEPLDLGSAVHWVLEAPDYLNFDEVVLKPIDQASHGITVDNLKRQF